MIETFYGEPPRAKPPRTLKDNGWEARFGALRAQHDKELLEALEAQIAREEEDAHERVARVFGRRV